MISTVALSCLLASLAATASATGVGKIDSCSPGVWALTFDDGPSQFTDDLLKTLREEDVKATFFVVGDMLDDDKNVQRMRQAYESGHQIAVHTQSHRSLDELSVTEIEKEMRDTEARIVSAIGVAPTYMRPPFGNCGEKCLETQRNLGYTVTMWNVDSRDWEIKGEPKKILENMKRYGDGLGPEAKKTDKQGVISLQHDINEVSVELVPKIIRHIKRRGFKFATVAECGPNRPSAYRSPRSPSDDAPPPTRSDVPPSRPRTDFVSGSGGTRTDPLPAQPREGPVAHSPRNGACVPVAAGRVLSAVFAAFAVVAGRMAA